MDQNREAMRRIAIAINSMDGAYEMISRKIGVKENTMILLYALDDGRPHTQKEICEEWLIPKTTLNTIVRECVKSGYLVLQTGRREKEIRLTEQGKAYAASVLNRGYERERRAADEMQEQALHEFVCGLEKLAHALRKHARAFYDEP